jgi:hypothetical protein
MSNYEECIELADSFINGNISHVVNDIGARRADIAAALTAGVYEELLDRNLTNTARSFGRAVIRHAGNH